MQLRWGYTNKWETMPGSWQGRVFILLPGLHCNSKENTQNHYYEHAGINKGAGYNPKWELRAAESGAQLASMREKVLE